MTTPIQETITSNRIPSTLQQESKIKENDFYSDGQYDYYSKSKSKKYRASKFRMISK